MPTPTIPMPANLVGPDGLLDPSVEVTLAHAAEITSRSIDTVRRALRDKRLPHARQDTADTYGRWWFPVADLVAAGMLAPTRVLPPAPVPSGAAPIGAVVVSATETTAQVEMLREQIDTLSRALVASQDHAAALTRMLERALTGTAA